MLQLDTRRFACVCRGDMQQLDGKWSQWWRQSSDMCDNLQHQMSLLCSQQEVTTQRMQQLGTQVHMPHSLPPLLSV